MRTGEIILPDLGTGADEPIIVSCWFAEIGDEVWEGDRLVEVIAGPATFDVSAPCSGALVRIDRDQDSPVRPGEVLGLVARRDPSARDESSHPHNPET